MAYYNTIFRKHIIPQNREGHNYYDANNIRYVENLGNVETILVVVDSASRNWDKETPDSYSVFLGDTFHYVTSIELIDGYIPSSGYMITPYNNRIYFREDEGKDLITAEIHPGDYTIQSLLSHLTHAMTNVSPCHNTYTSRLNQVTHKVTLVGTKEFSLVFVDGIEVIGDRGEIVIPEVDPVTGHKTMRRVETSNHRQRYIKASIGSVLGFAPTETSYALQQTGSMVYDLHPCQYLGIFVNTENADDFKKVVAPSPENGANGAFAIASLEENGTYRRVVDNDRFIKTFNPPIDFNQLRVQFKTMEGYPYDFNGKNNYLMFEVRKVFNREIITNITQLV